MPFGSAQRPSLGVGLLSAALKARGLACETKYLPFLFSRLVGHSAYARFADELPTAVQAGEWVFSQQLYGSGFSTWVSFERDVLDHPRWGLRSPRLRAMIPPFLRAAPRFLELALASEDWGRFDVVGFSSSFQQTLASLCLAKDVKERHPHVRIVLGGPSFEASLGRVYMERFPFVDYVCTGEGDLVFPQLCENLRSGISDVPTGLLHRRNGQVLPEVDERPPLVTDLDDLPSPDYDDFYRLHTATLDRRSSALMIPLEASRGCWWGQASRCTFCGLNGEGVAYRRKSTQRVLEEAGALERRYGPDLLQFTDNILDTRASSDLLDGLAATGPGVPKFFEVKSNLSRAQLQLLRKAGVRAVQAGIESLSDSALRAMRKGVTAAQNVAFLRWSRELGIVASWNILYGVHEEEPADDEAALSLAQKLGHLVPPSTCSPIRMDRFSPNFDRWRELGFSAVRPLPVYRHLHPFPERDLWRLAYFFDYDDPVFESGWTPGSPLELFVEKWQERATEKANGSFAVLPHLFGGWVLLDGRFTRHQRHFRLSEPQVAALLACDAPTSRARALAKATNALDESLRDGVDEALAVLEEREAVVSIGDLLVTLPLLPPDLRAGNLSRA